MDLRFSTVLHQKWSIHPQEVLTTTQTRPTFNITGGGSGGSYTVVVANSGAGGFVVGQDFTFLVLH